jgi:hypothetical protein
LEINIGNRTIEVMLAKNLTHYFSNTREALETSKLNSSQQSRTANEKIDRMLKEARAVDTVAVPFMDDITEDVSIDGAVSVEIDTTEGMKKGKRRYMEKPENWADIGFCFKLNGLQATLRKYSLLDIHPSSHYWTTILKRWEKLLSNLKAGSTSETKKRRQRVNVFGSFIDIELKRKCDEYREHGITVNDATLKLLLMDLLLQHGDCTVLHKISSSEINISHSWCQRFWKRHNMSSRAATTKMREETPADFEEKRATYLRILSHVIRSNDIPDELICGFDETGVQLVPSVKRTRHQRGARRIRLVIFLCMYKPSMEYNTLSLRLICVGHEKSQITCGFSVHAGGGVVGKSQLIFKGLTTVCHPGRGAIKEPDDQMWCHSETHWQTEETFRQYILEVIIPYRLSVIDNLGLDNSQKMCFIIDLHYSHYCESILLLFKENFIVAVFIPAGCTDIFQVQLNCI